MSNYSQPKEEIKKNDRLLRRVLHAPPDFIIKPDGTPSSSCFQLKQGEDGLSVDIERLTNYEKSIQDANRFRLYALLVSMIYDIGLFCIHDPKEHNYAHALIKGGFSRGTARKLAKNARIVRNAD